MATAYLRAESAPVILPHNFAQAAAVMAQFDRSQIASAVEVLVNLLDVLDGDPDVELNGDETDHDRAEDCFTIGKNDHVSGPGCPIADPDCCEDADRGEETAAEDSFRYHGGIGAGCPLADSGIADDGGVQDVNLRDRELVRAYHRKHS